MKVSREPALRIRGVVLLALAVVLAAPTACPSAEGVSDYRAIFKPFRNDRGTLSAAIRQYLRGGQSRFLVLDPESFEIQEADAAEIQSARPASPEDWKETPFARALARQTAPPYPLQNNGLRKAEHAVRGYFLTADLCPSKKPLDRRFLEQTAGLPLKPPVPVALMVSGLWIQRHEEDLAWLKDQASRGRLRITWVNHSATHAYDPAAPLERNFLLKPGTDFIAEVLSLERILIERDLLPAPFFRFPGLVSDRRLIETLRGLSLIPIGSDAWLAKGESPQPGSVILVHGNGNEPEGIRLLMAFFDRQRSAFALGDTALLPLRDGFRPD